MVSSVSVVTGNIFVAIVCSISEQQSKIAAALSILRDDLEYDISLESWWRQFADLRQLALWVFFFNIPLLFVAMACSAILDSPETRTANNVALFGAAFFLCGGLVCFYAVMHINFLFRRYVLRIGGVFSTSKIDSTTDVLVYTGRAAPLPTLTAAETAADGRTTKKKKKSRTSPSPGPLERPQAARGRSKSKEHFGGVNGDDGPKKRTNSKAKGAKGAKGKTAGKAKGGAGKNSHHWYSSDDSDDDDKSSLNPVGIRFS